MTRKWRYTLLSVGLASILTTLAILALIYFHRGPDPLLDVVLKDGQSFEMNYQDGISITFSKDQEIGAEILSKMQQAAKWPPFGTPIGNPLNRILCVKDASGREIARIMLDYGYFETRNIRYLTKGFSIERPFHEAHSKQVYYYPSGKKRATGLHADFKKQGEWKTYYENGQVESEGTYQAGKRKGIWTFWNVDGSVAKVVDYDKE